MSGAKHKSSGNEEKSFSGTARDFFDVFLCFFALIFLPLGAFNALGHSPRFTLAEVLGLIFVVSVGLAAFVTLLLSVCLKFIPEDVKPDEETPDIDPADRYRK